MSEAVMLEHFRAKGATPVSVTFVRPKPYVEASGKEGPERKIAFVNFETIDVRN